MIVADRKPLGELLDMVKDCKKIMVLGCKGCVTVCNVGGVKEVEVLASSIKIARKKDGNPIEVVEKTIERQCDPEYIELVKGEVNAFDAVLSMACGVGPQFLAEAYEDQTFYPAVDTKFFGGAVQHGIWEERCAGCGTCLIHYFGTLCPIARCSKSLIHGPCGGSANSVCEIDSDIECIWDTVVRKKMEQGRLDDLRQVRTPKDWRTARDGGPRKRKREELIS